MLRVFITGGEGMVGKNLLDRLSDGKFKVFSPKRNELDLLNKDSISFYLKKTRPEIIIHCAGLVGGIQANIRAPYDFMYQNLQIGLNVLNSAAENNIPRLINLGSGCMYPKNASNPLTEDQLFTGLLESTNEGYAVAKLAVAKLSELISLQNNLHYKTYIPCNLFGKWDKFDPYNSHMIPAVIHKLHNAVVSKMSKVEMWGDGTGKREFMYAEDLADFIIFTLPIFDQIPNYINVGVGKDWTINEYHDIIAKVVGYKGEYIHDLSKPSGVNRRLLDSSQTNRFGWKPKHTLELGIKKTYDFYLNQL